MKKDVAYALIFVVVAFILAKAGSIIFILKSTLTGTIIYVSGWIILLIAAIIFGEETVSYIKSHIRKHTTVKWIGAFKRR